MRPTQPATQPEQMGTREKRLGEIAFRQGRLPDALRHLQAALRYHHNDYKLVYLIGLIAYQLNQFAEALKYFKAAHRLKPDGIEILSFIGMTEFSMEHYETARDHFLQLVRLNPGDARNEEWLQLTELSLGKKAYLSKEYATAIQHLNIAMSFALDSSQVKADILKHRGLCKVKLGMYDEASKDLLPVSKINPGDVEVWSWLAHSFYILGKHEEALRNATQALMLSPHDCEVKLLRGKIHFALQSYEKAMEDLRSCIHEDLNAERRREAVRLWEDSLDARETFQKEFEVFIQDCERYPFSALYFEYTVQALKEKLPTERAYDFYKYLFDCSKRQLQEKHDKKSIRLLTMTAQWAYVLALIARLQLGQCSKEEERRLVTEIQAMSKPLRHPEGEGSTSIERKDKARNIRRHLSEPCSSAIRGQLPAFQVKPSAIVTELDPHGLLTPPATHQKVDDHKTIERMIDQLDLYGLSTPEASGGIPTRTSQGNIFYERSVRTEKKNIESAGSKTCLAAITTRRGDLRERMRRGMATATVQLSRLSGIVRKSPITTPKADAVVVENPISVLDAGNRPTINPLARRR